MMDEHRSTFSENQLPAVVARAGKPLRHIPASECPLCDYERVLRRRLNPSDDTSKPLTVKFEQFRSHLGRHLEQLALFVLPKSDTMEQLDDDALTSGARAGDHAHSVNEANSEHSDESQGSGQNVSAEGVEEGMDLGQTIKESILGLGDGDGEEDSAPDFALRWQPPMDFQPPEKDFEVDDVDLLPRREDSMFGGDVFTPGWIRGFGREEEGFCGRCEPGTWHNRQDGSYEFDLTYRHGIDHSGVPLGRPSKLRQLTNKPGAWEGYCDTCQCWRLLRKTKMGWNWFRHCIKVSTALLNDWQF